MKKIYSDFSSDKILLKHIKFERKPSGYFQFVVFNNVVNQFYLYWHSNYFDLSYIFNNEHLDFYLSKKWEDDSAIVFTERDKLIINPLVKIINANYARVSTLTFSNWDGLMDQHSYVRWPNIIEKEELVERSAKLGEYLHKRATEQFSHHPTVGDIRGKGLLMGVELVKDKKTKEPFDPALLAAPQVHRLAMEKGCMIFPSSGTEQGIKGDTLSMAPPYIINESEIDTALDMIDEAITDFEKELAH